MLLIDTSVWISVFRDRTGQVRQKLEALIHDRDIFLTRFSFSALRTFRSISLLIQKFYARREVVLGISVSR